MRNMVVLIGIVYTHSKGFHAHLKYLSVLSKKTKKEIPIQSASTSTLLTDLMTELGIKTPRRYISNEISSWFMEIDFPGAYCVDEVLSLQRDDETNRWGCTEDGCEQKTCKVSKCEGIEVSVLRKGASEENLPRNCGNAVKITINETDGKVLHFDYYGISEIVVVGELFDMEPTPTSLAYYDPVNLEVKCPKLSESNAKYFLTHICDIF